MSYNPQNPNGQATSANSAPVVIASDQSALPVSLSGGATAANQTNATQKTQIVDGSGNVASMTSNAQDVNIKSGNPTSITANAGTNLNTSALALESGGNLATLAGTVGSSKVNVNLSSGSIPTGTNTIGNVIAAPTTTGGLSVASNAIKATATAVKGSAGQVYGWFVYNNNSAQSYLQFYNTTTGSTTVGTNVIFSIGIPANAGANVSFPIGIAFSTAITVAAATTFNGNTAPTNNVEYNIFYN
jgi:hypothetical protein